MMVMIVMTAMEEEEGVGTRIKMYVAETLASEAENGRVTYLH